MPLSYSQLKSYATCPRQFEYAFVKKLKTPLTPESCFGVSVHTTLSKWGKLEQASSGKRKAGSDQTTLFSEDHVSTASCSQLTASCLQGLWHSSFVIEGYPTRAAAEFDRARGERLMESFYVWWQKEPRNVVAVEKGFTADTLTGRFDRIEELPDGTLRIIDFKSGSLRSQEEVDRDLQISIYCMAAKEAFGKEVRELLLLFFGEDACIEVKTTRGAGELGTAKKTIALLAERIASKDYRPTPNREVCRNCPYRRICDVAAV